MSFTSEQRQLWTTVLLYAALFFCVALEMTCIRWHNYMMSETSSCWVLDFKEQNLLTQPPLPNFSKLVWKYVTVSVLIYLAQKTVYRHLLLFDVALWTVSLFKNTSLSQPMTSTYSIPLTFVSGHLKLIK